MARKSTCVSDNESEAAVFNVSKPGTIVRTRSSSKNVDCVPPKTGHVTKTKDQKGQKTVPKASKKAVGMIPFDEMDDPPQIKKKRKETGKRGELNNLAPPADQTQSSSQGVIETHFVEGDQVIKMRIEGDEEAMFLAESSEADQPISDIESEVEDEDDDISCSDNEDDQQKDSACEEQGDEQPLLLAQKQTGSNPTRDKIREIDDEMKTKMEKLEVLLIEGGLTESAKVLERCLKRTRKQKQPARKRVPPKKENPRPSSPAESNEVILNPRAGELRLNRNQNHGPCVVEVPSLETIYKNAVQKRISSLSEDADTSDLWCLLLLQV